MNNHNQEEFSESELCALLLENVEEYAIFIMNTERQVTSWNPGVARVLGYSEDEFIGQLADVIFTPEDRAAGIPNNEMEMAALYHNATDERWHVRKDQSRFWGRGIMVAIYTSEGVLRGFAKIVRDDTARKLAEDAVQQLNRKLIHMNEHLEERVQERSQVAHSLALQLSSAKHEERKRIAEILHDHVQQMLYGIQMRIRLLVLDAAEDSKSSFEDHLEQLDRLNREIIRTIRSLSVEMNPTIVASESVVTILRWLASHMEEVHGLSVTVAAGEDYTISNTDLRIVILQIVQELLFNIVKHAEVDHAHISIATQNKRLVITVLDEGRGFDVNDPDSIASMRTGSGLSSIEERLSSFQGRLEIDSQLAKGTQVIVTLPLA